MTSMFGRIEDDEVVKELFSFCEFRDAASAGRTCQRLKRLADATLDGWVDTTLAHLPLNCECDFNDGQSSTEVTLKRGWSEQYRSRTALVDTAIESCDPGGQVSLDADFDEDRARHLLRTIGIVDVKDFLGEEEGAGDYADEVGWEVKIRFQRMTQFGAARYVGCNSLRHSVLCLLRKADWRSIMFSQVKVKYRHSDYPSGSTDASVLLRIPEHDNAEIEYHSETSFAVH